MRLDVSSFFPVPCGGGQIYANIQPYMPYVSPGPLEWMSSVLSPYFTRIPKRLLGLYRRVTGK